MKSSDYGRLVERYLAGEMTVPEEQDFFIQVAVNDELRQMLKAYQIVDNALRKDRAATRTNDNDRSRSRAHIVAVLSATAPLAGGSAHGIGGAAATDASGKGAATASATTSGTTAGGLLAGATATKVVISIVAATVLSIGAFVVSPLMNDSEQTGQTGKPAITVPVQSQSEVAPQSDIPAQLDSASGFPEVIIEQTPLEMVTRKPEQREKQTVVSPLQDDHSTASLPQQKATTEAHSLNSDSAISRSASPTRVAPKPLDVDSISFKVDLELPKKRQ
jgi:hypothetical protein